MVFVTHGFPKKHFSSQKAITIEQVIDDDLTKFECSSKAKFE